MVLVPRLKVASGTAAGFGTEVRDEQGEPLDVDGLDAVAAARVLGLAVRRAAGEPVSVPVPRSLMRELVAAVRAARAHGGSDVRMCIELPAAELAQPTGRVQAALEELGRAGVALAVRGAGTGATSPAALAGLPLSAIVLDRGLDAATRRAVVALAHALELRVVAPGADSDEELEQAREFGCDVVEGAVAAAVVSGS